MQLNGFVIPLSHSLRNLSVTVDQTLSLQHVPRTGQACYLKLGRASSIRHYISQPRCSQNSHLRFFLSRIDYCKSVQAGFSKNLIRNFERFQIMLPASLAVLPGLITHLTALVLYSGFLSNPAFATKFFFSLNNKAPSCLTDLIQLYVPGPYPFFFFLFCQAHHCGVFIQKHSSIVTVFLLLTHSHVFVRFFSHIYILH